MAALCAVYLLAFSLVPFVMSEPSRTKGLKRKSVPSFDADEAVEATLES